MTDRGTTSHGFPAGRVGRRDFLRAVVSASAAGAAGGLPVGAQAAPGLLIRGGRIVTAERQFAASIRIRGERIAAVGPDLAPQDGERVVEARGLLVLPGGIDPHVHLPGGADDLTSGSEAALAGGITTLGNMTSPAAGERLTAAIDRVARLVAEQAVADFILHPVVREIFDATAEDLARLLAGGHSSVKIHMISPHFDRQAREFFRLIRQIGEAGAICMVHCEDYAIVSEATEALIAQGRDSARYLPEARPVAAEAVAVQRIVAVCEQTATPVCVVHLSSERGLRVSTEARAQRLPVYVETRPSYLHLTRELYQEPDPALYTAWPPLRDPRDVEALWRGLREGTVDTLGSDHSAVRRQEKLDPALTLRNLRPGFSNLDVMLPMLHSEGVVKGRISLERFAAVTSTNPARLFGLYPRKGAVAVGSDADLVLWDPRAKKVLQQSDLRSRADFLVYAGTEVTGWPAMTLRRGEVVFEKGSVLGRPGSGRLLSQNRSGPL